MGWAKQRDVEVIHDHEECPPGRVDGLTVRASMHLPNVGEWIVVTESARLEGRGFRVLWVQGEADTAERGKARLMQDGLTWAGAMRLATDLIAHNYDGS